MLLFAYIFSLLSWFNAPVVSVVTEPASVYLSTNKGKTWEGFAKGLPKDLSVIDILEHEDNIYLTAIGKGLYVLEKNSDTWVERNNGLPGIVSFEGVPLGTKTRMEYFPTSIAAQGDRLVLGSFDDGVYYSDNLGKSWQQATTNIDDVVGALLFTGDNLVAGTHLGIWQSADGGVNWKLRCKTGFRINVLAMHNDQLHIARQNGMGILEGDHIEWSNLETGWAIGQLISKGDELYAITAKNEVYRTKTGELWEDNKFAIKGLPTASLIDAIWNGYTPQLPEENPNRKIIPTSRGWIVGAGGGC